MTSISFKYKLAEVKELEAELKEYESKMRFYQNIMQTDDSLNAEEYEFAKRKANEYQNRFNWTCDELRKKKIKLSEIVNLDAFGYDSTGIVDDSYYVNQFKTYGYLVGIRL